VEKAVERTERSRSRAAKAYCREHPILVGLLVLGGVGGAIGAVYLPIAPDDMSLARRVLGGALAGVLFAICALGFRLFD
jgi:hypothetical protein